MDKTDCIMPEMPYCPCCKYGFIESSIDSSFTVWHCLRQSGEGKDVFYGGKENDGKETG